MTLMLNHIFISLTALIIINTLEVSCINLNCTFTIQFYPFIDRQYSCIEQNDLNIESTTTAITNIQGTHSSTNSISDVKALTIESKKVNFLPTNLAEKFTNLIALTVKDGRLKELRQKVIKNWPNLQYLNMDENDIEKLETDVFKFNPELLVVWFRNNKIRSTSLSTFDHLTKLMELDLVDNVCVSNYGESKAAVAKLLTEIKEFCVHSEVDGLKKEMASQTVEVESLKVKNDELAMKYKNLSDESKITESKIQNYCRVSDDIKMTNPLKLTECINMIGIKMTNYEASIKALERNISRSGDDVGIVDGRRGRMMKLVEKEEKASVFKGNMFLFVIVTFVIVGLTVFDAVVVFGCI